METVFSGKLVVARLERKYPYEVCVENYSNRLGFLSLLTDVNWETRTTMRKEGKLYICFQNRDDAIRFRMKLSGLE